MTELPPQDDRGWRDPRRAVALVLIAACTVVMGDLALTAAFHCDEANAFRFVTRFGSGQWNSPGRPGLLWLLLTPTLVLRDPVWTAFAMRLCAVAASVGTLYGVWRLTTLPAEDHHRGIHPEDRGHGGALALLLLATSMSWQAHSFEVRTDTFVVPATLLAMHLLWRDRPTLRQAVVAGLAIGAAGLFSQKSIYNGVGVGLGTVAFVAAAPIPWRLRERLRTAAVAVAAAGLLVVGWYALLALVNDSSAVSSNLSRAAANAFDNPRTVKMNLNALRIAGERAEPLYRGAAWGAVPVLLLLRRHPRAFASLVVLLTMLSTLYFHRGFFLYFIASFEPYAAIVGGAGLGAALSWLHGRLGRPGAAIAVALVALGVGWGARDNAQWWDFLHRVDNANQVAIQEEVHRLFPEPVPYWDAIGLIPGYPETTFFGTGPVRAKQRLKHGASMWIKLAQERKPLFFIHDYMSRDRYFRGHEQRWHWKHYLPYRPNLYLRGARARVEVGERRELSADIIHAGAYTVRFWGAWTGEATVGGKPVQDGDVLQLEVGELELVAEAKTGYGQLWVILGEGTAPAVKRAGELIDWSLYPRLGRERYQSYDSRSNSVADLLTAPHDPRARHNWEKRRARHKKTMLAREKSLAQPPAKKKKKSSKKAQPKPADAVRGPTRLP